MEGERLLLRALTAEDWDALWAIASDRELWAVHPAHDRWQEPVFRTFFDGALKNGGALVVIEQASGRVIGSSQFQNYEPHEGGSIEIGWTFLARGYWGSGANAEIKRLMLSHALSSVERALFVVGEDNVISRRAMTKIGGRLMDETRDMVRAGQAQRHVVYEIDRISFATGPLMRP